MFKATPELNPTEEITMNVRPHWWFFYQQLATLIVASIFGVVALVLNLGEAMYWFAGVALLLALLWFLIRYLVWGTTHFLVTTDRLITRNGVLNRSGIEIPLERVNTVFFKQTIFERLLGSGDLVVESASEKGAQMFTDIKKPLTVQNEIYQQMEANENRKFDRVGSTSAPAPSIPDQIGELDKLRQKGVLTSKEFEQKKAELLKRI